MVDVKTLTSRYVGMGKRMLKEGSFTACPQLARTESSLTVFLSRPCLGRMVYLKLKRGERLEVTP